MAGFYEEMADMARELLAPESAGGLGQGEILVIRTSDGKPADWPTWEAWEGVVTVKTYRIYGAVSGIARELVDGSTILAGDQVLICADRMMLVETKVGDDAAVASSTEVAFDLTVGEIVNIDGKPMTTLPHTPIPGAGVKVAHRYVVRG